MMGIGRLGVLPAQGHRGLHGVWQSEGNCSPQADRPSLFVKHFHSHLMSVPDDPHMRKARLREVINNLLKATQPENGRGGM